MQQPGRRIRRDWIIIAILIAVVAASWVGFFLYWSRQRPTPAGPVAPRPLQAAASSPSTQATRPAALVSSGPVLLRPQASAAPSPQSQPQPVSPVNSRDAALLQALQRAQEFKDQGKPRDALAELQRALQTGSSTAPSSQASPDLHNQLSGLLGQLSQSGQPDKANDNDALVNAAIQMLGSSASEISSLLDELEEDTGGRRKSSKSDSQQDRPAAPPSADVVARVYARPIVRQEIGASAEGPTDQSVARLNKRILEELLIVYGKSQGITASAAEIATYQRATSAGRPAPAVARPPVRPAPVRQPGNRQPVRPMPPPDPAAESAVLTWKATRSLYERYRGTVIAGTDGRLEPVGAFREFLREMQQNAAFRIEDARYEERLWAYYEQDFGEKVVPAEKVDFGRPWWLKPAASAKAAGQ